MAKKRTNSNLGKTVSQTSNIKRLINETDKWAYFIAIAIITILGVAYFFLWSWQPYQTIEQGIREFTLSIITNLIPVFLIFALSYAFLRRIQSIKSDDEQENLVNNFSIEMQNYLQSELNSVFESDFNKINDRLDLLSKTAAFAGRKEELMDLQRIQNNLKILEDSVIRNSRSLSDAVHTEFIDLSRRFRNFEEELRNIAINDVRRTLERELKLLQTGLSAQEVNELSIKIANSVEQSIMNGEENRLQQISKEIDAGFVIVQGKVNETIVELQSQQKVLSKNIVEKIDNHADVITFVSEIRNEREELINIMWKNIQDEFTGEIKQGLPTPKELIRNKLTQEMHLNTNQADELASDFTKTFLVYLSNSLGQMQKERFNKFPKRSAKKKKA